MDDENTPVVSYKTRFDEYMVFFRVCPKCRRFVKADDKTKMPEYQGNEPNATCKRCGRVQMPFCTWGEDVYEDVVNDAYAEHY